MAIRTALFRYRVSGGIGNFRYDILDAQCLNRPRADGLAPARPACAVRGFVVPARQTGRHPAGARTW